jgi:glycosyltransferase involved in cell wall biosynthesis
MSLQVSVIVPTYNRGSLIVSTLDSIMVQSHRPAEIIVVDDGSTDDTPIVVQRYGNGVRYLRIENSGPPRARNMGAATASAPWLAFCDSDDLWHPDKLRLQVRLFEQAPELEYGFTNSRTVVDDSWSAVTKFETLPSGYWDLAVRKIDQELFIVEQSMFGRLLMRQPIYPSTVMMKRTFFDKIGGWRESLGRNPAEDVEFHLRCVNREGIGVVASPVVGIRKHDSNFSGQTLRTTIGDMEMLRFVLDHNPAAVKYSSVIGEKIIASSSDAADGAFAIGDMQMVRELLKAVPYNRRTWKLHIKSLIAHCPSGMAQFLMRMTASFRENNRVQPAR